MAVYKVAKGQHILKAGGETISSGSIVSPEILGITEKAFAPLVRDKNVYLDAPPDVKVAKVESTKVDIEDKPQDEKPEIKIRNRGKKEKAE